MKAYSALNADHSWFKQLFELSPDPTWIIEGNRFVECNEAAVKTLGYASREEFLNVHPSKLSPPHQADGEDSYLKAERMMALAKDQGLHRFEWMHTKEDGTNFVAEVTLSAIELQDRPVLYCVWRDITERRTAECNLRDSEQRLHMQEKHAAEALTRQRDVLKTIIDNFPGGISLCGSDLRFTTHNDKFMELLDFPPSLFTKGWVDFEDLARFNVSRGEYGPGNPEAQVQAALARAKTFQAHRIERMRPNGRWLEILSTPVPSGGFVTSYIDITERKHAERALLKSKQQYEELVSNIPFGVYILHSTPEGAFALDYVSPRGAELFNSSVERLLADVDIAFQAIHPDDREGFIKLNRDGIEQCRPFEWSGRAQVDGPLRLLHIASLPDPQEDGDVLWHGIVEDITQRKQMEEQIRQLAFYDELTNLPNRRLLNDRLNQAMATNKRSGSHGAMMFLDLDNFKLLNDTYGHKAGDLLLIEAAERLKSCVREVDTVARLGGDEFVVMISELEADTSTAQAGIIAEKIRAVLAKHYVLPIRHDGAAETTIEHQCTVSIGVALFGKNGASADDILKCADTAMYHAKEAGRNLIRYYDSQV